MSSSPEEYKYSGVLFCDDRSLRSIGSYRIDKINSHNRNRGRRGHKSKR
jgi:hypothetical protein